MGKVDVWMPLYIGDYLRDTMSLTTEQHGAYLLMLMEHWMTGPLPDDDEELAAICRLPLDRWLKHKNKLSRFFEIEGGLWTQGRAILEQEKAEKRREAAAENGRKGGRPRKEEKPSKNPPVKPAETHGLSQSKPSAKANGNPDHNPAESSSPSPSPSNYLSKGNSSDTTELSTEYLREAGVAFGGDS